LIVNWVCHPSCFFRPQIIAMAARHVPKDARSFTGTQAAQLAQLLAKQAFQNAKDPNIR